MRMIITAVVRPFEAWLRRYDYGWCASILTSFQGRMASMWRVTMVPRGIVVRLLARCVIALLSVTPATIVAPMCVQAGTGLDDADPLLYSHVVVIAKVVSVDDEQIPRGALGHGSGSDANAGTQLAFDTHLSDVRILRGAAGPVTRMISMMPTRDLVGHDVVLCGYWNDSISAYVMPIPKCVFVADGGRWVRLSGDDFSREELEAAVGRTQVSAMCGRAILVVEGRVKSIEQRSMTPVDFNKNITLRVVSLDDLELLKGANKGNSVSFVTIIKGRGYRPSWRANVPEQLSVDQRWLVFLGWDSENGFYYPIEGLNGMLRVQDDRLILDNKVPYQLSRPAVVGRVAEVMQNE